MCCAALQVFQTTGALPTHPLYRARAVDLPPAPKPEGGPAAGGGGPGPGRPRKVKRDKIVRKPTAFNYFVKEKIGQYKTDGITIPDDRNNNELFKVRVLSCEHVVEQDPSLLCTICLRQGFRTRQAACTLPLAVALQRLSNPAALCAALHSCIATPPGAPALTLLDLDCCSGRCRSGRR